MCWTKTHKFVSDVYARVVEESRGSCCSRSPCSREPAGALAKMAGYDPVELSALPADAVAHSFGCGNPLAFSEVQPGQVLLDLGSGAGIDLIIAAKKVGPTGWVIGVDMTDAMIERARANIAAAGLTNVEVRKGLIEDLPVDDSSVDWVISNCVVNLSPDKPRVFREIARVLRPRGQMRVSDIVVQNLPEAIRNRPALYASCIAGAISEEAYLSGLEQAGLVDVKVQERTVYDERQLTALSASELTGDQDTVAQLVRSVVGKIWSATFVARRPESS